MKRTNFRRGMTVLLALGCVALLQPAAHAQTITPAMNDLILGFYATNAPGNTLDLEVDLGNMSNFYGGVIGSTNPLPRLAVEDLVNVYGAGWYSRINTDLFWGAVSTTGRAVGTPDGHAPVGTLWATRPAGQPAWIRSNVFAQKNASAVIEQMLVSGSLGTLYGASSTTNSSQAAVITASLAGSWKAQDLKTAGTSFSFFNPTVDNTGSVPAGGQVVSSLYELQPVANGVSGFASVRLGDLILTRTGLSFFVAPPVPVAWFSASTVSGPAPLGVTFTDGSVNGPTTWYWTFGDGHTSSSQNPANTFTTPGAYSVQLIASNSYGASAAYSLTVNVYDPYAWWQQQYFGSDPNGAPGIDVYGTGMNNTNKFLAGFSPANPSAYLHVISITKSNNNDVSVTYLGANGDNSYLGGPTTRTNVLEYTNGAGSSGSYATNNFTSTGVTNILSGGNGSGIVTNMVDPSGATNKTSRFYRVRVLVP